MLAVVGLGGGHIRRVERPPRESLAVESVWIAVHEVVSGVFRLLLGPLLQHRAADLGIDQGAIAGDAHDDVGTGGLRRSRISLQYVGLRSPIDERAILSGDLGDGGALDALDGGADDAVDARYRRAAPQHVAQNRFTPQSLP